MDTIYTDPILKKYADLIRSNTTVFKRVYFGDPIRIGQSELPALIIAKIDSRVKTFDNVQDQHDLRISLTVVTSVNDTFNDDRTMVAGVNSLYNLIEGRDPSTYALLSQSLLGIIRHNVELDSALNLRTDLNTMSRVDYGMTMGKRKEGAWSIEGTLELTANFIQNR